MRVELDAAGCKLIREPGDKRFYDESGAAFHMKRLLNQQGYHFKRLYPYKHGLTSCKLGLYAKKANIILWHTRYAIEDAAKEFGLGGVWFERTTYTEPATLVERMARSGEDK